MEERHNCFQAVFLCLNFLITSVIWCCIQEGLFEVCATPQTSQSRPVTLLGKLFCYNQPCHLQLLTCSSHRGLTQASLSSRMLGFKDVNSRSGIWYLGCALPFSYSTTNMLATHLASIGSPAVKVQRGFGSITNVLFHINLVKTKSYSPDYKCYSTFLKRAVLRVGL